MKQLSLLLALIGAASLSSFPTASAQSSASPPSRRTARWSTATRCKWAWRGRRASCATATP